MDAQQRLLLERTAEALSTAPHFESAAEPTSVMVGIGTVDYTSVAAHLGNSLYAASGALLSEKPTRCTSVRRVSPLHYTRVPAESSIAPFRHSIQKFSWYWERCSLC